MTERNSNNDEELFKKEMAKIGVTKKNKYCQINPSKNHLKNNHLNNLPKITYENRRLNAQKNITQSNIFCLSEFSVEGIDAFEKIEYNLFLLTNKKKRKLQLSKYSSNYSIDLHGYTIEQARGELCYFIKEASNNNIKYVQVIHGMSTSSSDNKNTLKSFCVHWLKQIPEVIAFCSAMKLYNKIVKINPGAINILLK
jgi:DNA-nicking Smr family endonuclease